jgi:hypothetical protein
MQSRQLTYSISFSQNVTKQNLTNAGRLNACSRPPKPCEDFKFLGGGYLPCHLFWRQEVLLKSQFGSRKIICRAMDWKGAAEIAVETWRSENKEVEISKVRVKFREGLQKMFGKT